MRQAWRFSLAATLCATCVALALADPRYQPRTQSEPSNSIRMDDGFEYALVDYGLGRIQIRYTDYGAQGQVGLSDPVFWVEFRMTNKSEHLIRSPAHPPSRNAADNWGNAYFLHNPLSGLFDDFTTTGRRGVPLLPPRKLDQYKPGESASEVLEIRADKLAPDVKEMRVYLSGLWDKPTHFFSIHEPLQRQHDMVVDESEPKRGELRVTIGVLAQPRQKRR